MNIEFEGKSFYMAFAVDEDNQWVIEDTIERQESKFVKCPKCEWDAGPGFDRIEFGEEHECTECGYTLSGEEVVDSLIEQGVIYLQKYNDDGTETECAYEDKDLLKKMVLEMLQ